MTDEESKIFIDSDWKAEAQREKDRLVEEEQTTPAGAEGGETPQPIFLEVVNMLAMQAAISVGGMKTPDGRYIPPDRGAAQHYIGLLEVLEQKTAGNLDDNEKGILSATLHELRLAFVNSANAPVPDGPDTPAAE